MAEATSPQALADRYDSAASRWRDKMRALGYYDGYLGFLSAPEGTKSNSSNDSPSRR